MTTAASQTGAEDQPAAVPAGTLQWIDIAKGVGIVCVLVGHIVDGLPSHVVYMFHMPLFFFLGGYLHKVNGDRARYAASKAMHMLVPYLTFLVLLYVPRAVVHVLQGDHGAMAILKAIAIPIVGGRLLGGPTAVFWFVTCFFLTQQLFNALALKCSARRLAIVMAVFYAASLVNWLLLPNLWLPWNANVVLAACPIYWAGHLFRRSRFDRPSMLVLCLLSAAALGLLLAGLDNRYDMKKAAYGIPLVTFVSAIAIVLLLLRCSKLLEGSVPGRIAAALGTASMGIMYLHQEIQIDLARWPAMSNGWLRLLVTLAICYLLYLCATRFAVTRGLLLGSAADLRACFGRSRRAVGAVGSGQG